MANMLKFVLVCTMLLAVSAGTMKIHDYDHHGLQEQHEYEQLEHHEAAPQHEETEHHHEIEHKHATSHQSVKFVHHHPVPVYIKDQHLVKHPIEIGGTKQKLKILHPETEKNYNHGLVLEHHSESHFHGHEQGGHEHQAEHEHHEPQLEHYEHYHHE